MLKASCMEGWRHASVRKCTCPFRGLGFNSQHALVGLQTSLTPVPGAPTLCFDLCWYHTYRQNSHIIRHKFQNTYYILKNIYGGVSRTHTPNLGQQDGSVGKGTGHQPDNLSSIPAWWEARTDCRKLSSDSHVYNTVAHV